MKRSELNGEHSCEYRKRDGNRGRGCPEVADWRREGSVCRTQSDCGARHPGGGDGEAACGARWRSGEPAQHSSGYRDSDRSEGRVARGEDISEKPGREVLTAICELKELSE